MVPYFQNMATTYPNTPYATCDTQVKLNNTVIHKILDLSGDSQDYVTKTVFDATDALVKAAIEDWPGAAGSVWEVIQDIYHIITNSSMQSAQALSQQLQNQNQTVSLAARVSAIEQFLSSQGYTPPN